MNNPFDLADLNVKSAVHSTEEKVKQSLLKRRSAERRFRWYGLLSIGFGLLVLLVLFADISRKGYSAICADTDSTGCLP